MANKPKVPLSGPKNRTAKPANAARDARRQQAERMDSKKPVPIDPRRTRNAPSSMTKRATGSTRMKGK